MSDLKFEDVSFSYSSKNFCLIKNYHKKFNAGANINVIGDNGSGKSTMGKLICGLLKPTSGRIKVSGNEINNLSSKARICHAYYITQINQLQFISNSIQGEINFAEKIVGKKASNILYEKFFLPTDLKINPFDLDINESWRFSLYLSTIINPMVLFVDEISSASNYRNRSCLAELLDMRKEGGTITFVAYQRRVTYGFDEIIEMG